MNEVFIPWYKSLTSEFIDTGADFTAVDASWTMGTGKFGGNVMCPVTAHLEYKIRACPFDIY